MATTQCVTKFIHEDDPEILGIRKRIHGNGTVVRIIDANGILGRRSSGKLELFFCQGQGVLVLSEARDVVRHLLVQRCRSSVIRFHVRIVRLSACHEGPVSYTHLRAHETRHDLVCRLLLEKKKKNKKKNKSKERKTKTKKKKKKKKKKK